MDITADAELPDQGDNIIRTYDLNNNPNPKGLGHELFWNLKKNGESIAQIHASTGRKDTYKDILQRSVRAAIEMKRRGITPDDIVTPCTSNHMNTCIPFIASLMIGAKVASLDPSLTFNDTAYLLKQIKPKMIFISPETETLMEAALLDVSIKSEIVVFGDTSRNTQFSEFLKSSPDEDNFEPIEVKSIMDTAIIFFSSGVTGLPKGICTNHFSLMSQMNIYRGLQSSTVQLMFSSLYWLSGAIGIISAILTKSVKIICPKFDPLKIWKDIETYGVTTLALSPADFMTMVKLGRPGGVNTSTLRMVGTGGSPLSSENILAMKNVFPNTLIVYPYGLTEVSGALTAFSFTMEEMKLMLKKGNSVGKPVRGFWYKIVDPETEETLGPNQKGELRVKTKLQMNGYYNLDSSVAFDSEGWLKTGDICLYDDDHCFFVVDRIKETLKYRNWHVPPALLEGILFEHPAVKTAVVIGKPHEEDGDHPLALIELIQNAGNITPEEIEKFVGDRVDDKQRLRGGVRFITDVPYTPSGKVNRRALKKRILEEGI